MTFPTGSRLLAIYNRVALLAREANYKDTVTEAIVLDLCNMCTEELVRRGVFVAEDVIDLTSGTAAYEYPDDCVEPIDCWWTATNERLARISNERQYKWLLSSAATASVVSGRYFTAAYVYFWPTPSVSGTGLITLSYKQAQTAMAGTDETDSTPPVPFGHDQVYVEYCAKEIFLMKRGLSKGDSLYSLHERRYDGEVQRLFGRIASK